MTIATKVAALLEAVLAGETAFAVPVLLEGGGLMALAESGNTVSGIIDVLDCAAGSVAAAWFTWTRGVHGSLKDARRPPTCG